MEAKLEPHQDPAAAFLRRFLEKVQPIQRVRDRLLEQDVTARFGGGDRHIQVHGSGIGDNHGLRLMLFERLLQIGLQETVDALEQDPPPFQALELHFLAGEVRELGGVLGRLVLDGGELGIEVLYVGTRQMRELLLRAVYPVGERLDVGIVRLAALEERGSLVLERD